MSDQSVKMMFNKANHSIVSPEIKPYEAPQYLKDENRWLTRAFPVLSELTLVIL